MDNQTGNESYSGSPQSDGRADNKQQGTERADYNQTGGQMGIDLTDNMVKLVDDEKKGTKSCTEN